MLVNEFGFDPSQVRRIETTLPAALILHLNLFFDTMLRDMPELGGPEFDAATDYSQHEGKREIFIKWLEELSPKLKENGDLSPEYKHPVREYVIDRYGFDPYEFDEDDEDDVAIPTSEELNRLFNEEPAHPEDDIVPMSPEELERMYTEDVYDPGSPEERRHRHSDDR
jgi:hypothetical protein